MYVLLLLASAIESTSGKGWAGWLAVDSPYRDIQGFVYAYDVDRY